MRVFVTVGSTRFDLLVRSVLSPPVLSAFCVKGYTAVVVQCGNSDVAPEELEHAPFERAGAEVHVWRFKPSLEDDYDAADLVVSHAGSGTILDVLRRGKPLIVVPNESLLDNHQEELAEALSTLGHLMACRVSDLAQTILDFDSTSLTPFPPFDGSRFSRLLDSEMGYKD